MTEMLSPSTRGPLILGAGGRLGRALRTLSADGHWPLGRAAIWHGRDPDADLTWDMLAQPAPHHPGLASARGVIVLAGVTAGTDAELARNTDLALSAIDLARRDGLGPVLLMSSAAVYGRATGTQGEDPAPQPAGAYGTAKLEMERAVAARISGLGPEAPSCCCLRLANVAGCDQLFDAAAAGPVLLDRFGDGRGPRRAYVGPLTLARVLGRLIDLAAAGTALPPVLNLASPGSVAMADILDALGADWRWRDAPASALPETRLDTARLASLLPPLEPATPAMLRDEARLAAGAARALP